jgi:hypothetical protein
MLMGRYHFHSVAGEELTRFSARARREFALLVEGTEEQKRVYALEKARWVSLRQELEDVYLLIENSGSGMPTPAASGSPSSEKRRSNSGRPPSRWNATTCDSTSRR